MRNRSERETLKPHYTTTFFAVPDEPISCGLIAETIQYMSPKQTEGKDAIGGPIFLHLARLAVRLTDKRGQSPFQADVLAWQEMHVRR
jgi:hypothetical protein